MQVSSVFLDFNAAGTWLKHFINNLGRWARCTAHRTQFIKCKFQVSGVLNSLVVSIQEFKPYGKAYDSLTFSRFSLTTGMCP